MPPPPNPINPPGNVAHEDNEDIEDTDENEPCTSCPLCAVDDVNAEFAGMVNPTNNMTLRKIMGFVLANFGVMPNRTIYSIMARQYNREIYKPMRRAGLPCKKWTVAIVRTHFEEHVSILPRRVLGKDLLSLEQAAQLIDKEMQNCSDEANKMQEQYQDQVALAQEAGEPPPQPPPVEIVKKPVLDKLVNIIKAKFAVLRDYRAYHKEDLVGTGVDTVFKSVNLGETSITEAQNLLDAAAAQDSAGAALPVASELFD